MVAIKLVKQLEAEIVRGAILKDGHRIDGRNTTQLPPIEAMVRFLPPTHCSALVTRAETQALCPTSPGTKDSDQMHARQTAVPSAPPLQHYHLPPPSLPP